MLPFNQHPLRNLTFIFLFIMTFIFFQLNRLTVVFIILFCLLLFVVFLQEKQRVFVWITIAYFIGELMYLYGNRFLNELSYHINILLMLDKLLLLFPIVLIFYVCWKFKQNVTVFFKKTSWNKQVSLYFINNNKYSISVFQFILAAITISIITFIPFIVKEAPILKPQWLFWIIIYACISSIMEEILWRGIIMTTMRNLTNESVSIFFSSAAYGFSYFMFGYSLVTCMLIALFGLMFAWITCRSGSIVPAMIWHFFFQVLMVLSGSFQFLPI